MITAVGFVVWVLFCMLVFDPAFYGRKAADIFSAYRDALEEKERKKREKANERPQPSGD